MLIHTLNQYSCIFFLVSMTHQWPSEVDLFPRSISVIGERKESLKPENSPHIADGNKKKFKWNIKVGERKHLKIRLERSYRWNDIYQNSKIFACGYRGLKICMRHLHVNKVLGKIGPIQINHKGLIANLLQCRMYKYNSELTGGRRSTEVRW